MNQENVISGYFDGACAPTNPTGHIGIGCVIGFNKKIVHQISDYKAAAPENSNNLAEYMALNRLLDYFIAVGATNKKIIICGDSLLVIRQMQGDWRINEGAYVQTAYICKGKVKLFSDISFKWIPREQNTAADKMSNEELIKRGIKLFEKTRKK